MTKDDLDLDPKARRRAQIRASVARHKARLDQMSRAERVAWKARKVLGEDFEPYTAAERARLEEIREKIAGLQEAAEDLNARMAARIRGELATRPELAVILAELESGAMERIEIKPI